MFSSPVCTGSLEMLMFLHYSMENHLVEWRAVIIFGQFFIGQFPSQKRKLPNFFNRFDIAHCNSQLLRSSTEALLRSVCLLFSCIGKVVIDRRRFRRPKVFCRRASRKQLKTQVFSEGKCYFVTLLGPNIPCMTSQ